MLAQAITASLIESEPDLKAARQSEIEAAGSAQPLHSPEQPNDAGTPYSSTSQTLPVPKWTSAELGVDTSSAPGVSTPTPGGSSPSHPRPIRSPARQGSTGSRPGSASRRSASGISQVICAAQCGEVLGPWACWADLWMWRKGHTCVMRACTGQKRGTTSR